MPSKYKPSKMQGLYSGFYGMQLSYNSKLIHETYVVTKLQIRKRNRFIWDQILSTNQWSVLIHELLKLQTKGVSLKQSCLRRGHLLPHMWIESKITIHKTYSIHKIINIDDLISSLRSLSTYQREARQVFMMNNTCKEYNS